MRIHNTLLLLSFSLAQGLLFPGIIRYLDRFNNSSGKIPKPSADGRNFTVKTPDGVMLKGSAYGSGDLAVFFSHGWTCNRNIFGFQVEDLKDKYLCVTYDQRGHGESEIPPGLNYSTEALARDLDSVVEMFDPASFVIAGHSMGGFAALKFYEKYERKYGDRLKGLILIDSTGTALLDAIIFGRLISLIYPRPLGSLLSTLGEKGAFADVIRKLIKDSSAAYFLVRLAAFGNKPCGKQVEFMTDMVMSTNFTSMVLGAKSCLDFDFSEQLHKLKVPSLLLVGEKDRLTSLDANRRTQSKMLNAQLVVFPGAGHCTLLERADLVNLEITYFLGDVFTENDR